MYKLLRPDRIFIRKGLESSLNIISIASSNSQFLSRQEFFRFKAD